MSKIEEALKNILEIQYRTAVEIEKIQIRLKIIDIKLPLEIEEFQKNGII